MSNIRNESVVRKLTKRKLKRQKNRPEVNHEKLDMNNIKLPKSLHI